MQSSLRSHSVLWLQGKALLDEIYQLRSGLAVEEMVESLGFGHDVVAQATCLGAYQVLQFASRLGIELFVFFGL